MTVTTKPLSITLNYAEQTELRRFLQNNKCLVGVDKATDYQRYRTLEDLTIKGYTDRAGYHKGFDYYRLKDSINSDQLPPYDEVSFDYDKEAGTIKMDHKGDVYFAELDYNDFRNYIFRVGLCSPSTEQEGNWHWTCTEQGVVKELDYNVDEKKWLYELFCLWPLIK